MRIFKSLVLAVMLALSATVGAYAQNQTEQAQTQSQTTVEDFIALIEKAGEKAVVLQGEEFDAFNRFMAEKVGPNGRPPAIVKILVTLDTREWDEDKLASSRQSMMQIGAFDVNGKLVGPGKFPVGMVHDALVAAQRGI
jgi:hypothetical protein